MNLTVREAVRVTQGQLILGDPKTEIDGLTIDTRRLRAGQMFISFKGANADGDDFALSACRQGAAAVMVRQIGWLKNDHQLTSAVIKIGDPAAALVQLGRFFRDGFKGPVVGIAGSNGKTTTKQMTASILGTKAPGLSTRGNFNSQIGLPLILSELEKTHEWMALEMGDSAVGHISALSEMARPTVGVVTSIGPEHMATFGSMKSVVGSKWELMEALPNDGAAILPWEEPLLQPYIRAYKKRIVFFGQDSSCSVRASAIEVGETIRFRLHVAGESADVRLPVPGRFNVSNALASAAVGWVLGYSLSDIVKGLERYQPAEMRLQILKHSSGTIFVNDAYNANPNSVLQSVRTLIESFPRRAHIAIIGSMLELGEESDKYHFHVGAELGRMPLERVYLIGKETGQVKEGAVSSGAPPDRFQECDSHETVAKALTPSLGTNTVVLLKGSRGMRLERILEVLG